MKSPGEPSYFFDRGIRFECLRCGQCCTVPGFVTVTAAEIPALADFLGLPPGAFRLRFLYRRGAGFRLREFADGRCVFYAGACRVYGVRPRQCRAYPFCFSLMRSEHKWQAAVAACPGIGRGRRYTRERLLALIASTLPEAGAAPDGGRRSSAEKN